MQPRIVCFASLGLGLLCAAGRTADPEPPAAVAAAKQKYGDQVEALRGKYLKATEAASAEYLATLEKQIDVDGGRGDLERVLAFRAERDRVAANKPLTAPTNTPKNVLLLRGRYETSVKAARAGFDKAAKQAHAELLSALDQAVKEETKAGRLDAAVAVQTVRRGFEKDGPPADPRPAAKPDARPELSAETGGVAKVPPAKPGPANAAPAVDVRDGDFDWGKAVANPARVKVADIESIALNPKADKEVLVRVPDVFTKHKAVIYSRPKDRYAGVADITVLADGYLFAACNFVAQGNSGGGWMNERWTAEQFVSNGWRKFAETDLGGALVTHTDRDREQTVFARYVQKGEHLRLRCNKYTPPYVIVFEPGRRR